MLASDRSRVYIRSRTRKVIRNDYEGLDCGAKALCSWQYKAIGDQWRVNKCKHILTKTWE